MPRAPGQPEPLGDDRGELDGGRGHEPDPLAGVEVAAGDGEGPRIDLADDALVEDLAPELDDLG